MRDNSPGDLSIRLGFARGMGIGEGALRPRLEITDGTSGRTVTVEMTAGDIAEMIAGGEVRIPADRVTAFKAFGDFGKYHHMVTQLVKTQIGDYNHVKNPRELPYVDEVMKQIEAAGYVCDQPRRNNQQQWVIVGRMYTDSRDA